MTHSSPGKSQLRSADLGYVAGIIDGEGFIRIRPSHGGSGLTLNVGVDMTDLDVLEKCQSIVGVGYVYDRTRRGKNKPIWMWRIHRQCEVVGLLFTIYPFLGQRRQARVREAIAAWKAVPPRKRPEAWGIPGENGCGTYAGWAAHYRHKNLPPCQACRDASNEYRRSRRKRP